MIQVHGLDAGLLHRLDAGSFQVWGLAFLLPGAPNSEQ